MPRFRRQIFRRRRIHSSNVGKGLKNRDRGGLPRLWGGVAVVLTVALLVQLFRWQVLQREYYVNSGEYFITSTRSIINRRGSVFTADGVTLATDRVYWVPFISVTYDEDYEKLAEKWPQLVRIFANYDLKLPPNVLPKEKLAYYPLSIELEEAQKLRLTKQLQDEQIIGVYFKEEHKRIYPGGRFASHVIGFSAYLGDEFRGLYGVEGYFWPEIQGRAGRIKHERDIQGNILTAADYKTFSLREGKNIVLTIRSTIQSKVEEILEKKVKEFGAASGTVVIMDPRTGAILAMATYPTYDPNTYSKVEDYSLFKNKAVSDPYEYGSVQKPLTLAMALQEEVIKPDYTCYDAGVLEVLDKKIYNYHRRKYGLLDLIGILRHSDNVCAATVGLKLSPKVFYNYLHRMGIGVLLNVGIKEEETGYIKPWQKWNKVDLAVASFGQMVSATPLQILSAHSTLANKGRRMQPFLIREIFDGQETYKFEPYVAAEVFSPSVVDVVVNSMTQATMSTGVFRKYKGRINIAGKTGTAQIPSPEGGYLEDLVNTTFVGFAPAEDPLFVMLVKFERLKEPVSGATTAAPTWGEIFEAIRKDLGIDY